MTSPVSARLRYVDSGEHFDVRASSGAEGRWLFVATSLVCLERVGSIPLVGSPGRLGALLFFLVALRLGGGSRLEAKRMALGCLYIGASAVSYARIDIPLASWMETLLVGLQFILLYIGAVRVARHQHLLRSVLGGTVLASAVLSVGIYWSFATGTIAARYYFPGQSLDFYLQTDHRYTFPGIDPNYAALFIALGLIVLVTTPPARGKVTPAWLAGRVIAAASLAGAIGLTGSRGMAVAGFVAVAAVAVKRARLSPGKLWFSMVGGAIVLYLLSTGLGDSSPLANRSSDGFGSRVEVILSSADSWLSNPLVGLGRVDKGQGYVLVEDGTRVHTSFFAVLFERGPVALIALLGMLVGDWMRRGGAGRSDRTVVTSALFLAVASLSLNVEEVRIAWVYAGLYLAPAVSHQLRGATRTRGWR